MVNLRGTIFSLLACVALLASAAATTQACSIDGVPSIKVNGYDVVVNKVAPVGNNLKLWAPFLLPFALHAGRDEVLGEVRQRVAMSLEGFKYPWRWSFGDGTTSARGTSVHHVYRMPGTYKVTVQAYFASHKFWYTFDAVQLRVLKS